MKVSGTKTLLVSAFREHRSDKREVSSVGHRCGCGSFCWWQEPNFGLLVSGSGHHNLSEVPEVDLPLSVLLRGPDPLL